MSKYVVIAGIFALLGLLVWRAGVRYALQRFVQLAIVFVLVTFGVLVVMRIGARSPLDLAYRMLGGQPSPALAARTVEKYHLDRNFFVQYLYWLRDFLFHHDLGYSVKDNLAVSKLLSTRVWTTVLLGAYSIVFALLIAIPTAVYSAYYRDRLFDRTASLLTFIGFGVPAIVLGVLLKLLFVVHWDVFPSIGTKIYPWQDFGDHVRNFFLPVLTITIPLAAVYTRLLRADMVLTLQSDFVTLASAKGVPPGRVLWKHALRNSLFSIVTAVGTQLGAVIGSTLVVEYLFDLDGLGSQLVDSVLTRDLFTVQSLVAVIVALVVVVNLVVDLSYAVIDPRIRQMRALG
jgi:peptide/nickel transport system permease protein